MVLLKARTRVGGEHDDWTQRVATQQLLQMHYDSLSGSTEISTIPRVFHGTSRQRDERFSTIGRVHQSTAWHHNSRSLSNAARKPVNAVA